MLLHYILFLLIVAYTRNSRVLQIMSCMSVMLFVSLIQEKFEHANRIIRSRKLKKDRQIQKYHLNHIWQFQPLLKNHLLEFWLFLFTRDQDWNLFVFDHVIMVSILSVLGEDYSRNVPCALNLTSTGFFYSWRYFCKEY